MDKMRKKKLNDGFTLIMTLKHLMFPLEMRANHFAKKICYYAFLDFLGKRFGAKVFKITSGGSYLTLRWFILVKNVLIEHLT